MTAAIIGDAPEAFREMDNLVLKQLDGMILAVNENHIGTAPGHFVIEFTVIDVRDRHGRMSGSPKHIANYRPGLSYRERCIGLKAGPSCIVRAADWRCSSRLSGIQRTFFVALTRARF